MTTTATDKQMTYRDDLLAKLLGKHRATHLATHYVVGVPQDEWVLDIRSADYMLVLAVALALPEPSSKEEASDQIDALRLDGAGLRGYARDHRDWAATFIGRESPLAVAWGRTGNDRPEYVTVAEFRTLVSGTAR